VNLDRYHPVTRDFPEVVSQAVREVVCFFPMEEKGALDVWKKREKNGLSSRMQGRRREEEDEVWRREQRMSRHSKKKSLLS
jgi:hypothetical protein